MMKIQVSSNFRQIIVFTAIGGTTFLINNGIYLFLLNIVKMSYGISVSVAYVLTLFIHYTLHKKITYQSNAGHTKEVIKYSLMLAINYSITMATAYTAIEILHINMNYLIIYTSISTYASSYLLMKYYVFK